MWMWTLKLFYFFIFFVTITVGSAIADNSSRRKSIFKSPNFVRIKSEIKCREYRDKVYPPIWMRHPTQSQAFTVTLPCASPWNQLIAGGDVTRFDEFPHVVALGWSFNNGTIGYFCGGTLVSEQWVLTAAHCTHQYYRGRPSIVHLGKNRLSDKSAKQLRILKIIRHPGFQPPQIYNDLALLKLEKPITFDKTIQPACLYREFDRTPPAIFASGWGVSQNGHSDTSDILIKARLDIIDNIECGLKYNKSVVVPRGIAPTMICAGDPHGGWMKDTCQGDSGGPIHTYNSHYCLAEIVGITSFGVLCATPNVPGVYTRVAHYLNWIEEIVWP